MENKRNISGKNLIKKKIKNRLQTDWVVAMTMTLTFIGLDVVMNEINWSWAKLLFPMWFLAGVYLLTTLIAMCVYFISKIFSKK